MSEHVWPFVLLYLSVTLFLSTCGQARNLYTQWISVVCVTVCMYVYMCECILTVSNVYMYMYISICTLGFEHPPRCSKCGGLNIETCCCSEY